MNATPGVDGLLEGVIAGIANELMPYLSNEKAQATAAMMQSLLQGVRQMIPVYETYLIEEHNDMTATLRRASDLLADVPGAEADRIRKRAATMGQYADIPLPPDRSVVERVHTELGRALEASMGDLDVIQRSGGSHMIAADEALNAIRAHLGPRYLRDFQTLTVGGGMLGRG